MKRVLFIICSAIILFNSTNIMAIDSEIVENQYGVIYHSLDGGVIKSFVGHPGDEYDLPEINLFSIENREFVCFSSSINTIQNENIDIYPRYDHYKLDVEIVWFGQPVIVEEDFKNSFYLCTYDIYLNESDSGGEILIDDNRINEITSMDMVKQYCKNNGGIAFKTNIQKGNTIKTDQKVTIYVSPYNYLVTYSTYLDGELFDTTQPKSIIVNSKIESIPKEIEGYTFIERTPSTDTYDLSAFSEIVGENGPYDYKLYYEKDKDLKYFVEFYNGDDLVRKFEIEKGELIQKEYLEMSQYNIDHYSCVGFDRDLTIPVESNLVVNILYEANDCNVYFYYDEFTLIESNVQKYYQDIIYPNVLEFNIDNEYPAFVSWPETEKVSEDKKIFAILDEDIYFKDKIYNINVYQTIVDGIIKETSLIETQKVKRNADVIINNNKIDGYTLDKITGNSKNIIEDGDIYYIYMKNSDQVSLSITMPFNPYYKYNDGQDISFKVPKNFSLTESELNKHLTNEKGLTKLTLNNDVLGKKFDVDTVIGSYHNKEYKAQFYAYKMGNYYNIDKLIYYETIKMDNIPKPNEYDDYRFVGFDRAFTETTCDNKYYAVYIDKNNDFFLVDESGDYLNKIDINDYPNIILNNSKIGYTPISKGREFPVVEEINVRKTSPLEVKLIFSGNVDFNKYSLDSLSYGGREYFDFSNYEFDKKSLLDKNTNWIKVTINADYDYTSELDYFIIKEN